LSIRAQREHQPALFQRAVEVFERALKWDEQDDYAHHYLAFNLDVQGRDAPRVERHYTTASALQPGVVYWWSRYVTFLITRGRMADAQRAWSDALDALGLPNEWQDEYVYMHMHLWVARLLVHRGQLDFAEEVLAAVPEQVVCEHPGIRAIRRRMEALLEARLRGAFVPGPHIEPRWWASLPHLLPPERDGQRLERWWAGRVDVVEEGVLFLRVATLPCESEPELGMMEVSFDDFDAWSDDEKAAFIESGRFLELGSYQPGGAMIARVHRDRPWVDEDLPPLWPDPTRYLKA